MARRLRITFDLEQGTGLKRQFCLWKGVVGVFHPRFSKPRVPTAHIGHVPVWAAPSHTPRRSHRPDTKAAAGKMSLFLSGPIRQRRSITHSTQNYLPIYTCLNKPNNTNTPCQYLRKFLASHRATRPSQRGHHGRWPTLSTAMGDL